MFRLPIVRIRQTALCRFATVVWALLGIALWAISGDSLASSSCKTNNLGQSAGATARFVADRNKVSIIEFSGNFDRDIGDMCNAEPRAVVAREFYQKHVDNYDFLVIFTNFEFETGDAVAFHGGVKNSVSGIGSPIVDNSQWYGSKGRLLATIDMAHLGRYANSPTSKDFDWVVSVLSHEMLHQWGAFVSFKDVDGTSSDALLGKDKAHWSYLLDTQASLEYGSRWRDNGDGTFTAISVSQSFSPLDLYLMGVYSKEEVPPFFLIENPAIDRNKLPELNATVSGAKRLVSIDDVIAAMGPRVPSAAEAPKDYRMAFVYLVRPGDQVSDAEMAKLEAIREAISTRIPVLTGGRMAVNVYPATRPLDKAVVSPILSEDGGKMAVVQADSALAWLRSRQNLDGFFSDSESTRVRDSAVALATLKRLDAAFGGLSAGRDWLATQPLASVDYIARRAALLGLLGQSDDLDRDWLLGSQNADGGWGVAARFRSDPLDTALAMLALEGLGGISEEALVRASQYLTTQQGTDGGWANVEGGASRSLVTTQVMRALAGSNEAKANLDRAVVWLKSKQNPDGGFGDSPSTVHDTANVLLALSSFGATQSIDSSKATQYIASNQRTDGSWQGSCYTTAVALDALKRMSYFNWNVVRLSATPTKVSDGQRITLEAEIHNDGNLPTPVGLLRLFDGDPAVGGQRIGDVELPAMAPGSALAAEVSWSSFNKAGPHIFYAVSDPTNAYAELSESDNVAIASASVVDAAPGTDLLIATQDISVTPGKPDHLPSNMSIAATVSNTGQAPVAAVRMILREGAAGTGALVGDTTLAVPARGSAVANFTVPLTKAGATYTVEVDPEGVVTDLDRSNNVASVQVSTTPTLDLEVLRSDIQRDRSAITVGDDVTFTVKLRNKGTLDSPSAKVRHLLISGGQTVELASNNVQLLAGQQIEQTIKWRADRAGTFEYLVEVDVGDAIAETDETNNAASMQFAVAAAEGINLAVIHTDLLFTPEPALEGKDVTISALVANLGNQPAANVPVAFYNGDPSSGGMQIGAIQYIPTLAPSSSAKVQVVWPLLSGSQDKLIFVVVDHRNTIVEANKGDNSAFNVLNVKSLPDLAVSEANISIAPMAPKPGDSATVTVSVANLGQQPADNVVVRLFEGDPAAGTKIGADQRLSLAPLTAGSVSWPWTPLGQDGSRLLSVVVDPDQQVMESNRANNQAQKSFVLQNAAFAVSNRYFSPNGDGVKDTTTLSFRLDNPATVTIMIVDSRNRQVRMESGPAYANVASGSYEWDGLDNRGRVVTDGDYKLRLVSQQGTVLGEVLVTSDTNRSPLLDAFDTPDQLITNQTCDLANFEQFVQTADEQSLFAYLPSGDKFYPPGIYRASAYGADWRAVVTEERLAVERGTTPGGSSIGQFAVSQDGNRMAMVVSGYDAQRNWTTSLWLADGEGRGLGRALDGIMGAPAFSHDGKRVILDYRSSYNDNRKLVAIDASPPFSATVVVDSGDAWLNSACVSRDRRRMLVQADKVWSVDTDTGVATQMAALPSGTLSPNCNLGATVEYEYSEYQGAPSGHIPGGATSVPVRVSVTDGSGSPVREFTYDLAKLCTLEQPTSGGCELNWWDSSRRVIWAASEQEFVFDVVIQSTGGLRARWLLHGDVITGEVEPIAHVNPESDTGAWGYWGGVAFGAWAPAERNILLHPDYTETPFVGLYLDDREHAIPPDNYARRTLLGEWAPHNLGALGFSASGRRLFFNSNRDANDTGSSCYNRGSADTYSFESLQNLTVDLRPVRSLSAGGIRIRGTAADRNLSSYRIEYAASATPNDWRPVQPAASDPVVDQVITTWAPPAFGTYFLRLTAEDRAGNTRSVIKRVSWSDTAAITDLWRKPEYISPNGDTVQDAMTFHYRVLEPVHLEFVFFNAAGDRIRTLVRDHSSAGGEYEIQWDGRDEVGRVVPDGEYRMVVADFEFSVKVDNTVPDLVLEVPAPFASYHDLYPDDLGAKNVVVWMPRIAWNHIETNPQKIQGIALDPAVADSSRIVDLARPSFTIAPGADISVRRHVLALVDADYVGQSFHVEAGDKAGNQTVTAEVPAVQQIAITGIAGIVEPTVDVAIDPNYTGMDATRRVSELAYRIDETSTLAYADAGILPQQKYQLWVDESIKARIVGLRLVLRTLQNDQAGRWTWSDPSEQPVDGIFPVRCGIAGDPTRCMLSGTKIPVDAEATHVPLVLPWDPSKLGAGRYRVQVRATTDSGEEFLSPETQFQIQEGVGLKAFRNAQTGKWDADLEYLLNSPPSHADIFIAAHAQDPRFAVRRKILSLDDLPYQAGEIGRLGIRAQELAEALVGADLRACTSYELTAEVTTGQEAGVAADKRRWIVSSSFTTSCLDIRYLVGPEFTDTCNGTPSGRQTVVVSAHDGERVPLTLLEFGRGDPSANDILFNVNQPQDDKDYSFALDTANLPEGAATHFIRVTNLNGRVDVQPVQVVVDRQPPVAEILYPKEGQRLCAKPYTDAEGNIHNLLNHELHVEDQNAFDFQVEYGVGNDPVAWSTAGDPVGQVRCKKSGRFEQRFKQPITADCVYLPGGQRAYNSLGYPPDPSNPEELPLPYVQTRLFGPSASVEAHGQLSSRLKVFDKGGHVACRQVSYFLDGKVETGTVTLDRTLISPNGDGELDSATFRFEADEDVDVEVRVFKTVRDSVGEWVPLGDPVRTLRKQNYPAGAVAIEWDGKDDGSQVVVDGPYLAILMITDGCGNLAKRSLAVDVDNTPPAVTVTTPRNGDVLSLAVSVDGSVSDAHLSNYRVMVGKGPDPESWQTLGGGMQAVQEGLVAAWNTFGLEDGDYTLQIVARDAAMNERVLRIPVKLVAGAKLIQSIEANPSLFSPNADGKRDDSRLHFTAGADILASVSVIDGAQLVRVLTDKQIIPAGPKVVVWDGKDAAGKAVPDKRYLLRLTAESIANPAISQVEQVEVEVDATPPSLALLRPDGAFAKAGTPIMASVSDRNLADYKAYLTSTPGSPVWREIASGVDGGATVGIGSLEGLVDGQYAIRLVGNDLAENAAVRVSGFEIDSVAPQVALTSPANGSYLSGAKGAVAVKGTLVEKNFKHWQLLLDNATEIAAGDIWPADGSLLQWDVARVPDGAHSLTLLVDDKAGNRGSAQNNVVVDNTPPTVAITTPADGGYVGKAMAIAGTARDVNLKSYLIELATGHQDSVGAWIPLANGDRSVDGGLLADWQMMPGEGDYVLRVTATDLAGNSSQTSVQVTVDTVPPQAPLNLKGGLQNRIDAKLNWTASTSADVVGYRVYRGAVAVNPELLTQTEFIDVGLAQGTYTYTVNAVDHAGWESAASNQVQLSVKLVGPVAAFVLPAKGSVVSGLMDVRGTAAGDNDFKEYRLYLGTGADPADWMLLRRSPTPVLNDLLAQWNTIGLAENVPFTLKLEAEDTFGNMSADRTTVTVDNTPPRAPIALTAVKSGTADARLDWTANTEPDLAGYLVFRDERIVNASGAVVGNLKPYLVTATTYLDVKVPDGDRVYYVIAMDNAGNLSEVSNRATLSFDNHPPHAVITKPVAGAKVDKNVYVTAISADTDIAKVQFQYRLAGNGAWTDIGAAVTNPPYTVYWDTVPLKKADYDLQAIATDKAGMVDPAPTPVRVTVSMLDRPEPPIALAARVNANTVNLSWTASPTSGVTGYHIVRSDSSGTTVDIKVASATATAYPDSGVADGAYRYTVAAVDAYGNESNVSNAAAATVYTPAVEQPYTPTLASSVTLRGGQVAPGASVIIDARMDDGSSTRTTVVADVDGRFVAEGLPLAAGNTWFEIVGQDALGNVSNQTKVHMLRAAAPSAPTAVTVAAAGNAVTLGWAPNPEPDLAGYRVFRNGHAMAANYTVSGLTASASRSDRGGPSFLVDGVTNGSNGSWAIYDYLGRLEGQWVEVRTTEPVAVSGVTLYSLYFPPTQVELQAWNGEVWVPVANAAVVGNETSITLERRYVTDGLRVVIKATDGQGAVDLSEVSVLAERWQTGASYADTVPDGKHRFSVTAVSSLGFESVPSTAVDKDVGDVVGPDPVVLTAQAAGADVHLSWTASASPDIAAYEVWRDGAQIGAVRATDPREYVDVNRPNASYTYVIQGVDAAGNRTSSNDAVATVAQPLPAAPLALVASTPAVGKMVDLTWTYPATVTPAPVFDLLRADQVGGPYTSIATKLLDRSYRDTDVSAGLTYFYVVQAEDSAGNAGPLSNEAAATPHDLVAPDAPVLSVPTKAGVPFSTRRSSVRVGGLSEPGASVLVVKDNREMGTTNATAEVNLMDVAATGNRSVLSPDGRLVAWCNGNGSGVVVANFIDSSPVTSAKSNCTTDPAWYSDSTLLAFTTLDYTAWTYRVGILDTDTQQVRYVGSFDTTAGDRVTWSPDGTQVAVIGSQGGREGLWILDLASGVPAMALEQPINDLQQGHPVWADGTNRIAVTVGNAVRVVTADGSLVRVANTGGANRNPDWIDGGRRLILEADQPDGSVQLVQLDVDADQQVAVTSGIGEHSMPSVSPDGRAVAYWNGNAVVSRSLVDGSETIVKTVPQAWSVSLRWLSSGYLSVFNGGYWGTYMTRADMPGRFEFGPSVLAAGDNVFTAYATDAAGNRSFAADPIVVRKPAAELADLAVGVADIQVQPAVPTPSGQAVVQLRVRNLGTQPSVATTATILAIDQRTGSTAQVLYGAVPALAAGEQTVVSGPWAAGAAGSYQIVAVVDPDDLVGETTKTNNAAVRDLMVADKPVPTLRVATDAPRYGAGADVLAHVTSINPGQVADFVLRLKIEDTAGYEVASLPEVGLKQFGAGEVRVTDMTWNTGTTVAGAYRLHGWLVDANGKAVVEATAPVAIAPSYKLTPLIQTDRASYTANDDVNVAGSLTMDDGNAPLQGLVARIRVLGSDGAVLAERTQPLGSLLAGSPVDVSLTWNVAASPVGSYRAVIDAIGGTDVLASAGTDFAVLASSVAQFQASFVLDPDVVSPGEPTLATVSMKNLGNVPLTDLPLTLVVRDPAVAGSQLASVPVSLTAQSGATVSQAVRIDTTGFPYKRLDAVLTGSSGQLQIRYLSVVDRVAPQVGILMPTAGSWSIAGPAASVSAIDRETRVASVEYRLDGGAWTALPPGNLSLGLYGIGLAGLADGTHVYEARATDIAGNVSPVVATTFNVDRTLPTIVVTGVVDQGQYASMATPVVTVSDANLDTVVTTLDGNLFVSGSSVTTVGGHILAVTARDKAGNEAKASLGFTILAPNTPPAATLNAPIDGSFLKGAVIVTAVATDKEGPVKAVEAQVDGGAWQAMALADAAAGSYALTLSGLADGRHTVSVRATDSDDAYSPLVSAAFTADNTAPAITITGVADGGRYTALVTPVIVIGDANPSTSAATLDGNPFVSGTPVNAEGKHQLVANAMDKAGNAATATLGFQIDMTPPTVIIASPVNGATLAVDTATVAVTATDQLSQVVKVEAALDSLPWADMTASAAGSNQWTRQLTQLANGAHTLKARGSDAFGNVSAPVAVQFTVNVPATDCITGTLQLPLVDTIVGRDATWSRTVTNQCKDVVDQLPVTATLTNTRTGKVEQTVWSTLRLNQGASDQLSSTWRADGEAGDVMAVKLVAQYQGKTIDLAAGTFRLAPPLPLLNGVLFLGKQSIVPGEVLPLDRAVTNASTRSVDIRIRLALTNASNGSLLTEFVDQVSLPAGATNQRAIRWPSAGVVVGDTLRATLTAEVSGVVLMLAQETVAVVAVGGRIDVSRDIYRKPRVLALMDCEVWETCAWLGGRSLETMLAGFGVSYRVADDRNEFAKLLGCEWYNVIWIDSRTKLSDDIARRVREAAQLGVTVIVQRPFDGRKYHDDDDNEGSDHGMAGKSCPADGGDIDPLEQAAGMKTMPSSGMARTLRRTGDWLGTGADLPLSGGVSTLQALAATKTQPAADSQAAYAGGNTAFSVAEVGHGAVAMSGFDLVASAIGAPASWTSAIRSLLAHAARPVSEPVAPRKAVPLSLQLASREALPVILEIKATLPAGMDAISVRGGYSYSLPAANSVATWTVVMWPGDKKTVNLIAAVPKASGWYDVRWEVNAVLGFAGKKRVASQVSTVAVRGIDVIREGILSELRDTSLSSEADRVLRDDAAVLIATGLQAHAAGMRDQALSAWLAAADKLRALTGTDLNSLLTDLGLMVAELQHGNCESHCGD